MRLPDLPERCVAIAASAIPGRNQLLIQGLSMPFLAQGSVSYAGEPVVLIAAPDRELLGDLVRGVYIGCEAAEAPEPETAREIAFERGDPEGAFASAGRVVEGTYSTGFQETLGSSPLSVVAARDERDIHVTCPTSDPFALRDNVAALLDLPTARVRVHAEPALCPIGGRELHAMLMAGHAALVAHATSLPVRLVYTQKESLAFTPKRAPCAARYRSALDENGMLMAMDVELDFDAGAYPAFCAEVLEKAVLAACGGYRCENVRVRARLLASARAPSAAFAGSGEPQVFFALELHADRIAAETGLTPWEWRRRQLEGASVFPSGMRWNREEPLELLEDVLQRSDFRRKWAAYEAARKKRGAVGDAAVAEPEGTSPLTIVGRAPAAAPAEHGPLRGIGLAVAFHGIGLLIGDEPYARSAVKVMLDHEKKLRIASSQGADREAESWIRTASQILDIPAEVVALDPVDTGEVPDSGPSSGSRVGWVLNDLVAQACRAIKSQRLRKAPPLQVSRSLRRPSGAIWSPGSPRGQAYYGLCWEATVVEIEIDPITFQPFCRGVWTTLEGADSAGESTLAFLEGSVLYNLDYLLLDKGGYEGGAWIETVPGELPVLGILDAPEIRLNVVDRGKHGFGDLAVVGAAPAAAAAIGQAIGRPLSTAPIRPPLLAGEEAG